ncbi:MAG TPA: patatin-like phospholipase family protein [Gammaproteobacteria bacterium]|nr:patatin-like phospholipase family protein [Gammaproteobacteria bacterium]
MARCVPRALLAGLCLCLLTSASPAATPPANAEADRERPRIGLVLGGGGARGGAHVGVLKVLDELRVPVDCVAGTSMGALVGATFAAGTPPERIEREITAINWAATIGSEGRRALLPVQRKEAGITYSNNIEFSVHEGRLRGDSGLLASQHIESRLRLLIGEARRTRDFDDLPLPFRAVATDLASGSMVVLEKGDLARAMRASMAVPGVFAPVVVDGQVLTDGGLLRNLPVDVARSLCADVVIAVVLTAPPRSAAELSSPLALARRSIDAMIESNEGTQLATLGENDVAIRVPVGDIGAGDFDRVPETIPLGERATRDMAEALADYSLPEAAYRRWREALDRGQADPVRVEEIRFAPLQHASADYLRSRMRISPGDTVPLEAIEGDMNRIYASSDFVRVDYRLLPGDEGRRLRIEAVEKPGTDFLRFDLGLAGSAGGDVLFALRADHRREWVNSLGGQWRNALQLGQLSELETAFYQPLEPTQRFFIEPGLRLERSLEDVFDEGDRISRYELVQAEARVNVGFNINNHSRLSAGLRHGLADYDLDIGEALFAEGHTRDSNVVIDGLYDTRDASTLPTRGSYVQFQYTHADEWLGGEHDYQQLEAVVGHSTPWRGNVLLLAGGAGWTLDGDLPRHRDFRIGGARSFPALERGEFRGENYWSASATWLLKLADIQALFGQVFYGGAGLHALRVTDRIDQQPEQTVLGASFTLGARTPVGPLLLSLGVADNDSVQLHVALGRPIAEGSLLDRLH